MSERIVSFVMSGGVGSRLWPLSREDNPKQFHDFSGDGSMLAKTLRRLAARPAGETPIFLIASERHAERVHADLAGLDLGGGGPLFEPTGRNTAAAVALATLRTLSEFGDSLVLVVPSDHEISTAEQFWRSVEAGAVPAHAGRLVVFGIKPTQPETGYGYIEVAADRDGVFDVSRFVEKPDLATAQTYLEAGTFYWNTGIFLFRAGAMRDAFAAFAPDIWRATEAAYKAATSDLSGLYMPLELYSAIPSTSIDYAIMERAKGIAMVPAGFRWNDLGSWQSLLDVGPSDDQGNVIVGDVVAIDCENSYIRGEGRLLSAIGMKDVAIADATFVAPVSHSQHVKKIVEQLEKSGRLETRFTPAHDRVIESGAWRQRVHHWLFDETLPLWSTSGVDERHGGFHEALGFD
ncbi:MAG: mannose-1-phosphate guanylyltransferase, partial [Mesorhizobium sp.]